MQIKTLKDAVDLAEEDPDIEFFAVVGCSAGTVVVLDLLVMQPNPIVGVCQSVGIRVIDVKFGSAPGGRCLRLYRNATVKEPIAGLEYIDKPEYLYTSKTEAEQEALRLINGKKK